MFGRVALTGAFYEEIEYDYPTALREEALKLVLTQGLSIEQAAASVSIPKGILANWVAAARRGSLEMTLPGSCTVAELEAENARLREELATTKMKQDIVKKRQLTLRRVAAKYAWMKTARFDFPVTIAV